jgi:hypothetical protein
MSGADYLGYLFVPKAPLTALHCTAQGTALHCTGHCTIKYLNNNYINIKYLQIYTAQR